MVISSEGGTLAKSTFLLLIPESSGSWLPETYRNIHLNINERRSLTSFLLLKILKLYIKI